MAAVAGKTALITGASRGIGMVTAQHLARAGAKVLLVARTRKDLESVAEGIRKEGGQAEVYPADLSQPDAVTAMAEQVLAEQGVPDILINNAGLGSWRFVHETSPEDAAFMVKLPYLAAFWLTGALLPAMLKRGSGRIINVNSPVSIMPWGGAAAYASSRWALRGFTESLQVDLSKTNIKVCHAVFGEVAGTSYFDDNPGSQERLPKIAKLIPPMPVEKVARSITRLAGNSRGRSIKPFRVWLLIKVFLAFPLIGRQILKAVSYRIQP